MIHHYKLNGFNIILDVDSGAIHSVDDVAYDVICAYESVWDAARFQNDVPGKCVSFDDVDIRYLVSNIIFLYENLIEDDVVEIIDDLEALITQGKLFSENDFTEATNKKHGNILVTALCLNVSHACNMACAYCFAGCGDTGEESDNNKSDNNKPDTGNDILMSFETGKRAIDFLFENSGDKKNLDVDFFGGEPLLNWDVVKKIVLYARELECGTDKRFRFTLTTNGLLIDDDVINFTGNHMHNVVLSLDGRPEVHDAMRKLPSGSGSYSKVVDKIKKLADARCGKGYYIRSTFTGENKDFVNDILHIADLGFKELSSEPAVSGKTQGESSLVFSEADLPQLFKQYEKLAVEMLKREQLGTGFNFYHYTLDLTGGPCVHKRIAGCGVGTEYMAVTPSGELYPCHQFVGDKRFHLGNVWQGIVNTGLQNEFSACSIYSRTECLNCWAKFYCSGGCAANAYYDSGSLNGIYKIGCELFKKRMECAIMMHVAREMR